MFLGHINHHSNGTLGHAREIGSLRAKNDNWAPQAINNVWYLNPYSKGRFKNFD